MAQGLGSILSPAYIWFANKFGYRLSFFVGLLLCCVSLFVSSFTTSEHYLFATYSLPFGIGSSIIFVLQSMLTGVYYPPSSRYHITASVAISLGFPLGFIILSSLSEALMTHFDWKGVQRIYSVMTLVFMIFFTPLFTEKYNQESSTEPLIKSRSNSQFWSPKGVYCLTAHRVSILIKALWFIGLFCVSCANNSIVINLVSLILLTLI